MEIHVEMGFEQELKFAMIGIQLVEMVANLIVLLLKLDFGAQVHYLQEASRIFVGKLEMME